VFTLLFGVSIASRKKPKLVMKNYEIFSNGFGLLCFGKFPVLTFLWFQANILTKRPALLLAGFQRIACRGGIDWALAARDAKKLAI